MSDNPNLFNWSLKIHMQPCISFQSIVRFTFLVMSTLACYQSVHATVSPAQETVKLSVSIYESHRDSGFNDMFDQLKHAKNKQIAAKLEQDIWNIWLKTDNRLIASMMGKVMRARLGDNHGQALRLLNYLIQRFPDYSEAWNQRATIHYLNGDFEASLADVKQTLRLEPRHFGAIAGRATILWKQGYYDLALRSFQQALKIHPFLPRQKILF